MDWNTVAENPRYKNLYVWRQFPDDYQHTMAHRLMDMMTADEFTQWEKAMRVSLTRDDPTRLMDAIDAGLTPEILAELGGLWNPTNHHGAKLADINAALGR